MKRLSEAVFMVLIATTLWSASAHAGPTGEQLYKLHCAQCHGITGNGMGINVRDMSVQPRDHTDGAWMSGRSDADLFKAVKEGGGALSKSILMPPWEGVVSDEEIHRLVEYMRELCDCTHGSVR